MSWQEKVRKINGNKAEGRQFAARGAENKTKDDPST
jgi:hypothetical protein